MKVHLFSRLDAKFKSSTSFQNVWYYFYISNNHKIQVQFYILILRHRFALQHYTTFFSYKKKLHFHSMPVFIVRGIKTAQWLDKNGEEEFISYTIYAFQNYNVKKEL